MNIKYVVQTQAVKYTELFRQALAEADYDSIDVAVAYATVGGVQVLSGLLEEVSARLWAGMRKRWLVGIDWCRSDPPALRQLGRLERSEVRVPGGERLVLSGHCNPKVTFHPKLFLLSGPDAIAIICGSGNLSANGLLRGCECGSLVIARGSGQEPDALRNWFVRDWELATPYDLIRDRYQEICESKARKGLFFPTDDDTAAPGRNALSLLQIQQLRTFENMWIQSGSLGANLGRGKPGTQLDMKRFSRAYFGVPIEDVPKDTPIGTVSLDWDGQLHVAQTMRYGNNSMGKLNVPPPGLRGELFYLGRTLLFSRLNAGMFKFTTGNDDDLREWKRLSKKRGVLLPRVGQREWGLF